MKKCNKCLEEKDLYFFEKSSKNGYRNTCRKCRNTLDKRNSILIPKCRKEKN